jgi:hypothetical protein
MRAAARPAGQARGNPQKMRRGMLKPTKEGGRLHTEPILTNGIFLSEIQPVMEYEPYGRRGLAWPPDTATQRYAARNSACAVTAHSLRSAAQCLHSICCQGGLT